MTATPPPMDHEPRVIDPWRVLAWVLTVGVVGALPPALAWLWGAAW